jgi:hypothetical protein
VRNADIRIADHELWPMFGTHQLPDEFALLARDAPSGPPKHGRLKTIAVPRAAVGSPLGKAGLDSIIRACASRAGLQIPERPGISWGPLGGEGPPGKGAGLPSDAINCGSASSPYGEVSAPTAAGTVYKAVKAIYNVPKALVNQVTDYELFDIIEGKALKDYGVAQEEVIHDAVAVVARWEAEDAWESALEAELASNPAATKASTDPTPANRAAAAAAARKEAVAAAAAASAQAGADAAAAATTKEESAAGLEKAATGATDAAKAAADASKSAGAGNEGGEFDRDTLSACRAMQEFLRSCEGSDWITFECTQFLARLRNGADPALINPGPDGILGCTGDPVLTKEALETAFLTLCGTEIARPGPDGPLCVRFVGVAPAEWCWARDVTRRSPTRAAPSPTCRLRRFAPPRPGARHQYQTRRS